MGRHSWHHAGRPAVVGILLAVLGGCARSAPQSLVAPEPGSVELELLPAEIQDGRPAALVVRSPGADSIVFESANGVDRYWSHGSELRNTRRTSHLDR